MSEDVAASIIAIHGAGMSGAAWAMIDIDRLDGLDLPGHGSNDAPALSSIESMAEWLAVELDGRGGAAHLAGHSMGTLVALELAAKHPELVASLTLCATAASMPVHPDLLAAAEDAPATAAGLMAKWGHSRSADDRERLVEASAAMIAACAPDVLSADLAACAAYADAAACAAVVGVPVTIVIGADDAMTPPASAEELAAAFPTPPAIVTLDGVGHLMLAEAPSRITTTLSRVL